MPGFSNAHRDALRSVHRRLLSRFKYVPDPVKWGRPEFWEDASTLRPIDVDGIDFTGDCEEYARAAMHSVRRMGYNARLVVCRTEKGEGHLICEALSSDNVESWFFDNRQRDLVNRIHLRGYTFLSVSPLNPCAGDTRPWRKVT